MRSFVSNLQIKDDNKLTGSIPSEVIALCDAMNVGLNSADFVCVLYITGGTNNFDCIFDKYDRPNPYQGECNMP